MNDALRRELYERLISEIDPSEEISDASLYQKIDHLLQEIGTEKKLTRQEKMEYREILFAALRRYDILSIVMADERVTEIMVNGAGKIYVERGGGLELYEGTFTTEEKLSDIVQQIASAINRRVNEATPMADARLPDGSRVNIVLPPIALDGPAVTIRRFSKTPISMENLVAWGSITEEAAAFLEKAVLMRMNIFVSGGTGTGKTTFLGALAEYIHPDERVITIEDSAELRLRNVKNIVRLESRPANLEGEYGITIRDLIKNALRMRPDRIVVGEIRGGEALDMLQAMNTGHDGSLSTGHANSAQDMISRIETMCLMGNVALPLSAIRGQIAAGIDLMVHLIRCRNGTRRVQGIYELAEANESGIRLNPLYLLEESGTHETELKRTDCPMRRAWKSQSGEGIQNAEGLQSADGL